MKKEQVYDEQISPLMETIIDICKAHKIAMIADFALDGDLKCTSALLTKEYGPKQNQLAAIKLLKPGAGSGEAVAIAETIETLPDGRQKVTMTRIS